MIAPGAASSVGKQPTFMYQFGTTKFQIDTNKIDGYMQEKMTDAIAEVKAQDSIYARFPAEIGQDEISYTETSVADPEFPRLPDESPEEHAKRVLKRNLKPASAVETLAYLNKFAVLFGQPEIKEEEFKAAPVQEVRTFLFNVLNFANLPSANEFIPKRVVAGNR